MQQIIKSVVIPMKDGSGTVLIITNQEVEFNTYDFANLPQSLINNPSYSIDDKLYITIPLTENSLNIGSSGMTIHNLFADNNISIEQKIKESIYNMSEKDIFMFNQKNDILNIGYRIDSKTFLSLGFYEELDFYSNFPKSMSELFYEGTTQIEKRYTIEGFAFQAEMLGIYHIGLQKKYNDSWNIGARFKLYSGVFNAKSRNNSGYVFTDLGVDNVYRHGLSTVDVQLQTSGVVFDDYNFISKNYLIKKLTLSGNKGIGFDLGLTYYHDYNLSIAGSITDLGVLFNTHDNKSYSIKGNFITEGIDLEFDSNTPMDYWSNIEDEFDESVAYAEDTNTYVSWRPMQLNTIVKYSFGTKRYAECTYYGESDNDFSKNTIGGFLQFQKRPGTILPSASIFFEKNYNNILQARVSYTADKFSYTNIGLVASLRVWKVNLFVGANNLIGFSNLAKSNTASIQLGLSINTNNSKRKY
jgi:hypothetical protein